MDRSAMIDNLQGREFWGSKRVAPPAWAHGSNIQWVHCTPGSTRSRGWYWLHTLVLDARSPWTRHKKPGAATPRAGMDQLVFGWNAKW